MSELTFTKVDRIVLDTLKPPGRAYWATIALLFMGILTGAACWLYQILVGVGVAGMNTPVHCGTYLINFVFWVGITPAPSSRPSCICFAPAGEIPSPGRPKP